ncbi:MAG TPA: hypothetical protein PLE16_07815 [Spirochaetota bacterium]|nr:hypothetical protein [Spirochaetota bacterium]HPM34488.1 hypothetical protein [Spirochaetota bacterium]
MIAINTVFLMFFIIIIIETIIYSKTTKKPAFLGLSFSLTYLLNVIIGGIIIYRYILQDGESVLLWLLYIQYTVPISLAYIFYDNVLMSIIQYDYMIVNYVMPFIFMGIFGSIQYYLIGFIIGKIIKKKRVGASLHKI